MSTNTYHFETRGQHSTVYMDDEHKHLRRLLSRVSKEFIHRAVRDGRVITKKHRDDTIEALVAGCADICYDGFGAGNCSVVREVVDKGTIVRIVVYLHDVTNGIPKEVLDGASFNDCCEWVMSTIYFWPKHTRTNVVNQMMCPDTEEAGQIRYFPKDIFYKDIQ